jgi:hypothetical protein
MLCVCVDQIRSGEIWEYRAPIPPSYCVLTMAETITEGKACECVVVVVCVFVRVCACERVCVLPWENAERDGT